jgi:hypothetical protein
MVHLGARNTTPVAGFAIVGWAAIGCVLERTRCTAERALLRRMQDKGIMLANSNASAISIAELVLARARARNRRPPNGARR